MIDASKFKFIGTICAMDKSHAARQVYMNSLYQSWEVEQATTRYRSILNLQKTDKGAFRISTGKAVHVGTESCRIKRPL